ncbi:MAG: gas vesicle protein [bacterium]|nr:gas vesicle protein [Candidatus Sumerlaeota bacterium]
MKSSLTETTHDDSQHISLCETLDRVLNKGVVISGEVVISVANVDLLYLALQIVLTSMENARSSAASAAKPVIWVKPLGIMEVKHDIP